MSAVLACLHSLQPATRMQHLKCEQILCFHAVALHQLVHACCGPATPPTY